VTSWSHWRRGRFWVEIVLAVVVGVAAFVVAAVVSTAARSHVPTVLLGLVLLLAVLAVARFAGILYALPVGVVTIEAFDWYFLPPLRNLDGATVLVLGLFLAMAVTNKPVIAVKPMAATDMAIKSSIRVMPECECCCPLRLKKNCFIIQTSLLRPIIVSICILAGVHPNGD